MKENSQTEELRALFRELFSIEAQSVSKSVGFLGKLKETTLNEERLTLEEREFLKENGMLTSDSKNFCKEDDRTIFSHVYSAIYGGLYGYNYVDVTSHCLDTIKEKKGLKKNQNLVDFLSPQEVRKVSIALYTLINQIQQHKLSNKLQTASMANFYFVAKLAHKAGVAAQNAVLTKNSEFKSREFTATYSAKTVSNNTEEAIKQGTFSHMNFQCLKQSDPQYSEIRKQIIEKKCEYIRLKNDIIKLLRNHYISDAQIDQVFGAVDEGYYLSKYFRKHNNSINNLICRDNFLPTKNDMDEQINKLTLTKIILNNYFKKDTSQNVFADVLNEAFTCGNKARAHCMNKLSTSPEYLTSFAAALCRDKEVALCKA